MKRFVHACVVAIVLGGLAVGSQSFGDGPYSNSPYVNRQASNFSDIEDRVMQLGAADEPRESVMSPTPEPIPDGLYGSEWDAIGDLDMGYNSCCSFAPSCGGGMWYGSVDYLLMRPRFSQAIAESRRQLIEEESNQGVTSTLTDQTIPFQYKYGSAFRTALGYRFFDCGGAFQMAYWRMNSDSERVFDGPAGASDNNPFITGQLKNVAGNGDFFAARAGVTANVWDIDFAKCLTLGGPQNPCDGCGCPRWDLRWSIGARIGDISRYDNNIITDSDGNTQSFANINARWVGAGPRVGMQGRRYFGACGNWSAFAKGSQALLLGDMRMSRVRTQLGDDELVPTVITKELDNFSRMVPVTDIEVGGTWQFARCAALSAGWFFQCWWDLGQAETIPGTSFGPLDSSNILGFDGLFVRAELLF